MSYLYIASQVALPFAETTENLIVEWDQMPAHLSDFCNALTPIFMQLGLVSTEAAWESICVKNSGQMIPTKRISLSSNVASTPALAVESILKAAIGSSENHDLFASTEQNIPTESIQHAAEQLREAFGGKRIEPALNIHFDNTHLEISGLIPKNKQVTTAIETSHQIIYGVIDEPSVRDNRITIRTQDCKKSAQYFLDLRAHLHFVHQVQTEQSICKVTVSPKLSAQNKIIYTVICAGPGFSGHEFGVKPCHGKGLENAEEEGSKWGCAGLAGRSA